MAVPDAGPVTDVPHVEINRTLTNLVHAFHYEKWGASYGLVD
jgi:hypothetical protein